MRRSVLFLFLWVQVFGVYAAGFAEQNVPVLPVDDAPLIDGIANDMAWESAPVITTRDKAAGLPITIRAVYTPTDIFLLVRFPDPDESRTHKSWVWDTGRSISTVGDDREDVFVLKWNMQSAPVDLSIYAANEYQADIWFWKACRTDGAGYADDKIHILSLTEDRNATEVVSRTGETFYLLRNGDAGESAYRIKLISEYQGDILPRYIPEKPSGSRSDVRARGTWRNGGWTIEFARKLITGNPDDIRFSTDKKYLFGVSRYEIAGRKPNIKLSEPLYGTGDVNERLWLTFLQQ